MRAISVLLLLSAAVFALSPAEEAKIKDGAREFIKDRLKAPATAQFSKETICTSLGKPDFEEAKGTGPTPECTVPAKLNMTKDNLVYRVAVDSQNSYGALIRTKFQIDVFLENGKISFHDAMDSVRVLRGACDDHNETMKALHQKQDRNCDAEFPALKK